MREDVVSTDAEFHLAIALVIGSLALGDSVAELTKEFLAILKKQCACSMEFILSEFARITDPTMQLWSVSTARLSLLFAHYSTILDPSLPIQHII